MRPFAFAFLALALAAPAFAADSPTSNSSAPEKLLPLSTQLYLRWDGVAAHREAYKKSIWGGIMAGPTGDGIRTLVARAPKLFGDTRRSELQLDEKPIAELRASLADTKAVEKVIELVADKGVIVAMELREPVPTLKGLGRVFGGLIEGELPGPELLAPDTQVILIVPDVGDKADVLFGTLRMAFAKSEAKKIEPFGAEGRKGFRLVSEGQDSGQTAWWTDGKHFVFYTGARKPHDIIAEMAASAKRGGLTGHPLYQRCAKAGNDRRGFRGNPRGVPPPDMKAWLVGSWTPGG